MTFKPADLERADARLAYLVANKTPITPDEISAIICRVFVGSFVDEAGYETTALEHLVALLYDMRATQEAEKDEGTIVPFVEGADAEMLYVETTRAAYLVNGFDAHYANEAASWPEVLPMNVRWDPDLLAVLARLEVGHDLVVMDVVRNMHTARTGAENG
jgi:hypothetical protein